MSPSLLRAAPAVFVLIWSTGWISARYGAPYADPLTFLAIRFAIAGALVSLIARLAGAPWPASRREALHAMASGVLLHAIYLGGVWWAIAHGLPTGVSGLIAAVQPIMTAFLAPTLIGEKISGRQWIGIALGFVGIALVLQPKLTGVDAAGLSAVAAPIVVNLVGMVGVTLGSFYQKRFVATGDLRTITALQYAGAFLAVAPAALLLEPMRVEWNLQVVLTMAWSVVALSLGAIGLLLLLIRNGAVSRAAALIYLVPPTVAIEAFLLFGETLSPVQVVGMVVTSAGVALATRKS
ncbi:membrane protein [Alsobacter metallidurans]|uniref:Membrane protein n=1 Tax=Alsobacter metallidurans TaxID=340221 RepID=A0A917MJS8_9HYPH|nr:DMT family transporter [Alsobacter metallidurans]GGH33289.1 membrane protein [Alsobacter metallidurans]